MGASNMKKLTIAAGLMFLALASACGVAADKEPAKPRRVAVLPLKNLRPKTDTDWIGAGAVETLTTKLAALPQLILPMPADLSERIEGHDLQKADFTDPATAAKVGRLVGAERVLIGSYAVEGGNVLFNCRVVDVETAVVLSTPSVRAGKERLFDAFFQLAEAVIGSFDKKVVVVDRRPTVAEAPPAERITLTREQRRMLREFGTTNPKAYEALARGVDATDPIEVIRWYTRAIELDPKYAKACYARGVAYYVKGDYDRAIRDYDKAIELDPKYAKAYSNRGSAYSKKGDYDRAIKDFDKAIELNPKYADAYYNRGNAYDSKGDFDRAIPDYDKAIELDPKYAKAYSNRGVAYGKKGDFDRAIRDFNKAIELNPKAAFAYYNRGNAYDSKGDFDRAIPDYDKAIELD
ncbi:MAG TPA: tetratricopeptide repeat protein, partial [Phycisphaerae bacterium]|nr:tetratricopeptide repeat protein [Phycisphaerae bacterium]